MKTPAVWNVQQMLHGGDYNPDQWLAWPEVLREDLRLMRLAGVNSASVGIFAWAALEPEEGRFEFGWLDEVINNLHQIGSKVILATPSGAKPNWMGIKYPEIRRIGHNGNREPQQGRHNHCPTSPIYREKVRIINTKLAERYGKHPAVVLWHLSNEYNGECYCPLCKAAFRQWLARKYQTVEAMNTAYWSRFWAHTYSSFEQVDALDHSVHGLVLDWKRFMTDQCVDFMREEIKPLKVLAPHLPVTTNMMGTFEGLDYWRFTSELDVISWDAYPGWHSDRPDWEVAADFAFLHDLNRSLKRRPWLLMESTPSHVNWQSVSRAKRPGMHRLASLQAVAHGADGVCYFQWRKSRGSSEKFHGAVVDHVGHEHTRVFREVAALGKELAGMSEVVGTQTRAEAAVIFDWNNRWAIDQFQGARNVGKDYEKTVREHYRQLYRRGVAADVIESSCDLSPYKLVIAPMLYMVKPGVAENLRKFVEAGGTLVATYLTGVADENDLVFLGGWPGAGLGELFGIWVEELDAMYDHQSQGVTAADSNGLGLNGSYAARHYCEVVHLRGGSVAATYGGDYYAGSPAVTVNRVGRGQAIYVGSRNDERFLSDLVQGVLEQAGVVGVHGSAVPLPEGIALTARTDGQSEWVFAMNFSPEPRTCLVGPVQVELKGYDCQILRREAARSR